MSDLICYIPGHGFANGSDTPVFVSWLDANYWTSDEDADSFKLATTSGGTELIQFTETVTEGFVREFDDSAGITTISGLDHLAGEVVKVTSNGTLVATETVSTSGSITLTEDVFTYAAGKGYSATLIPMDLDIKGTGLSTTKRPNRIIINIHETIGGRIGQDADNMVAIPDVAELTTGFREVSLPGGYTRDTDVVVKQTDPLPMTILSLTYDLGASND